MKRIEVTVPAALDIDAILEVSERDFGPGIANRYELLIATGIDALAVDSARPGVRQSVDTAPGVRWFHLRSVRTLAPTAERIGRPRHILVFKIDGQTLVVLRVLHDAMDLSAHLP